jgi:hypothetical protein
MKRFPLMIAALAVPILLAIAGSKNSQNTGALTPVLGNYPDTSLALSTDTTDTPDASPMNTERINVSTSTDFKGTLEGNPVTGVVRVTDAHPAGAYTVTVRAFDSGGASATKTFTLTVTTPATCVPVRFAAAGLIAGHGPQSATVGGGTGTFDIDLPLTGSPEIECRTTAGTNDYMMVVTFSGAVTINGTPQAQVTSGTGCVGSAGTCNGGTVAISANAVTIPLTNVANAQAINVTLFDVNGDGNVVIPMGVLNGDVNANRAVNAGDVALTKSRLGQLLDATNFRADVNANGGINATDVSIVKQNSGTSLPP